MNKGELGFLIVGVGRGGTSLLMGLLDAHPILEVAMESHSMDCLMGYDLNVASTDFRHELAQYRCREFVKRCNNDAKTTPDKYHGNKITTEQIYGLHDHVSANGTDYPYLHDLFENALKGVKVIYILRDGRTNVRSKLQRTTQSLEHAVTRYRFGLQIMNYLQENHPDVLIVKYEALVEDTVEILKQVCDFLGVEYDTAMLGGVRNKKMPADYQNTILDTSKLQLNNLPAYTTQLLLRELRDTNYISKYKWLFYRIRYSYWWFYIALIILGLNLGFLLIYLLQKN